MTVAIAAFLIALAIGVFLYFRPKFINEGFATIALDNETHPKCLMRDAEAQELLHKFQGFSVTSPNSSHGEAYAEFKLILQKMLCIDADITGSGAGTYSTYNLPFATAHDIEPAASFVGRCVKHAARSRDVTMAMDKFEERGLTLLNTLCFDEKDRKAAAKQFHNIVSRVSRNIMRACLMEKASLDTPAGPRDPGYYTPPELKQLQPFSISGDEPQYI